MPKRAVKPFISKKAGESFNVVHRSQQDPKYYDEDASKYVLLSTRAPKALPIGLGGSVFGSASVYGEADDRSSLHSRQTGKSRSSRVSRMSASSSTSSVLLRRVGRVAELSEVDAAGLPLDGYNYAQHLAETGGGHFLTAAGGGGGRAGGSGTSVTSARSGGSGKTFGRGGRGGAGGALDTLSEVDERDAVSAGGDAADDAEARLEALVRGVEETRAVGARLGLPEDVLPSGLDEDVPRDLEAVSLRPDRMNPELRAALEDLEDDDDALDLAALEDELANGGDGNVFDFGEEEEEEGGGEEEDEEDGEAEEEDAAPGGNATAGSSAPPRRRGSGDGSASLASSAVRALGPHKSRAAYARSGRGGWEELDDDFVAQALGKVVIPGVSDKPAGGGGEEEGSGVVADAEGFDFDAHVARLMSLAEGQMVDADDLDDQGEGEEDGGEGEEEGEEDTGVEAGRRGGSSSRTSDALLAGMLAAYDDDNLGALDDFDPRLRGGYGAQPGTAQKRISVTKAAPVTFKLGGGGGAATGMPYQIRLDANGDPIFEGEEEYEVEEEEEEEEDGAEQEEEGHRVAAARAVRPDSDVNGGYVYHDSADGDEEGESEGEEEGSGRALPRGQGTLDAFVLRSGQSKAGAAARAAGEADEEEDGEEEEEEEEEDEGSALEGHMGEEERREALAAEITDPWGRPVKVVALDSALAAWELERDTRELESLQMAAKQAKTRLRVQEREEREEARRIAAALQSGEIKSIYAHVQEQEAANGGAAAAAAAARAAAAKPSGGGFSITLGGVLVGSARRPGASPLETVPETGRSAALVGGVSSAPGGEVGVGGEAVPFGCADGDLNLDALDYFPSDWTTSRVMPKWDAETILSTNTASEFRPRKLEDGVSIASRKGGKGPTVLDGRGKTSASIAGSSVARRPVSEADESTGTITSVIRLSRRTGLPVGLRVGPGGALLRVAPEAGGGGKDAGAHTDEEQEEDEEGSGSEADEGGTGLGYSTERRPDESADEKRARKAAVKAGRRVARETKKVLREAFKEEELKVTQELRAKDSVALGKGIIIRS